MVGVGGMGGGPCGFGKEEWRLEGRSGDVEAG